jgi:carboxylate-amine ligase
VFVAESVTLERRFGESPPFSIGVEEELMLLDAQTFEPVAAVQVLLRDAEGLSLPGRLKTELHASVVELNTDVCADVSEAVAALRELRATAARLAEEHGVRLAAAGAHPFASPEDLPIVPEDRYREMIEQVGWPARRQGVSGLHVHVGVASAEACFHAFEGVLPWLPVVLALSVNSPYLGGIETGLLSNRAGVLAELPRSGGPPAFRSYEEWEGWVERLVRLGVADDYTRLWWDVRPHPRLGTIEVRMPDQPTALERTGFFVAVLQALVAAVSELPLRSFDALARADYDENRKAAARLGLDARLVHPDGDRSVEARELADELLELVRPHAAVELLVPDEPEALLQLEVGRAEGLEAVCADLADRSLASS